MTNSGGTRSPARFAAPRGRGGDRGVPRRRCEPAAPLGAAGSAGLVRPVPNGWVGPGRGVGVGLRLPRLGFARIRAFWPIDLVNRRGRRFLFYSRTGVEGLPSPELVETAHSRACAGEACRRAGRESVSPRLFSWHFLWTFRWGACFVSGSRGVRRDEAATDASTDLGDRAEHCPSTLRAPTPRSSARGRNGGDNDRRDELSAPRGHGNGKDGCDVQHLSLLLHHY